MNYIVGFYLYSAHSVNKYVTGINHVIGNNIHAIHVPQAKL